MYLETINEKAFRSFLSNPDISVLDGNVLDKHHNSDFYRFVRVPLSDGEHSVEALFGQMCSNYPTSMSKNHFSEQHNLEFMAYVVDHEKTYAESYEFLRLFDVTSAYTGPHSAMGEMTKTLWNYLEQKTILDPDYLNTPELQNEAYENAVKQYVLQKKDTAFEESLRKFLEHIDDTATIEFLFEGATYDSVTDLVKDNLCLDDEESIQKYNEHPRFDPFIPYDELVDKKNADREDIRDIRDSHRLDTMADYVDMYSTARGDTRYGEMTGKDNAICEE